MFTLLPKDPKEKLYTLLIGLSGALRFLNLGFHDLQAWDESLYTVRAEGILRFGNWVDQSAFSFDGLYSALHPPLHVWLTAISLSLFGINEFAARLVSALFGLATPFVLYAIGKRIDKPETGFYAALIFTLNPFVTFLARQGQFDTTMVFFITAGFYVLLRSGVSLTLRNAILAGVMVGLSLMAKLFVGFGVFFAFGIWILIHRNNQLVRPWKYFCIAAVSAGIIFLPWHVYMTIVHGNGDPLFIFHAAALFQRTFSGIEGNIKSLEILYFINQLFVLFPFGVVWCLLGMWRTFRTRDDSWRLIGLWFLVFFIVFSLIRTKLAFYLLPALAPASLLAAREIRRASEQSMSPNALAFLVPGTLASFLWSLDQSFRASMKSLISALLRFQFPNDFDTVKLFVLTTIILCSVMVILFLAKRNTLAPGIPFLLLVPCFVVVADSLFVTDRNQYRDGAAELAMFVERHDVERIVVAGYERNPQLTYYLRGADIGWRDDISIRRIEPPGDRTLFRQWLAHEMIGEQSGTLLVIEKDKFIRYEVINPPDIVPQDFQTVFESRRYTAYLRSTSDLLAASHSEVN